MCLSFKRESSSLIQSTNMFGAVKGASRWSLKLLFFMQHSSRTTLLTMDQTLPTTRSAEKKQHKFFG